MTDSFQQKKPCQNGGHSFLIEMLKHNSHKCVIVGQLGNFIHQTGGQSLRPGRSGWRNGIMLASGASDPGSMPGPGNQRCL